MNHSEFAYTIYIGASERVVWEALTSPEYTHQYMGVASRSDWQPGSKREVQLSRDDEFRDFGSVVLESEPYRRLSFSDGATPPQHAEMLGWKDEDIAIACQEDSRVAFDIAPACTSTRVTVIHSGFAPDSKSLPVYREGWPQVMSHLKTLLETGKTLDGRRLPDG